MIKKILKKQKGFTLIEMVIYVGVASIVIVGIVSIVIEIVQVKAKADAYSFMSNEVANIFETMLYDVRHGDTFTVIDSSTLEIEKDGNTKQFYLQDGRVWAFEEGVAYELSSNLLTVTELQFTNWTSINSDNLLHVSLTAQKGEVDETFQTSIHQR